MKTQTHAEKLDALNAKHAAEVANLVTEAKILALIPEACAMLTARTHVYPLWDRVASVTFEHQRFSYGSNARPNPEASHVYALASAFPPVQPALFRDGCVSIRTVAEAEKAADRAEARNMKHETSTLAPMWLTFEHQTFSQHSTLHWFTEAAGVGVIEIRVEFSAGSPVPSAFGSVHVVRQGNGWNHAGDCPSKVIRTDASPADKVKHIQGTRASITKLASCDPKEPATVWLWWDTCGLRLDDEAVPTIAAMLTQAGV